MAHAVLQSTTNLSSAALANYGQFNGSNGTRSVKMLLGLKTTLTIRSFSGLRISTPLDMMLLAGQRFQTLQPIVAAPESSSGRRSGVNSSKGASSPGTKEKKWTHEGLITESLPNGMFRVRLDNEDMILGYVSGKIRRSFIRILPGDKVKVEVSSYDSTKGRITYRLVNKDSKDSDSK